METRLKSYASLNIGKNNPMWGYTGVTELLQLKYWSESNKHLDQNARKTMSYVELHNFFLKFPFDKL